MVDAMAICCASSHRAKATNDHGGYYAMRQYRFSPTWSRSRSRARAVRQRGDSRGSGSRLWTTSSPV